MQRVVETQALMRPIAHFSHALRLDDVIHVGATAGTIATVTSRVYVVTITSPTTVTMQSVGAFLSTAP